MTKIIEIQQDDIPLDIDITEPTPVKKNTPIRQKSVLSMMSQTSQKIGNGGRGSVLEQRKMPDLETNFANQLIQKYS